MTTDCEMNIINNTECEMCISDEGCLDFTGGYIYIYIAQLNKSDNEVITATKIKFESTDKITFKFKEDGFFTICRIRIHNGEIQDDGFFYDDKKFYRITSGEIKECELQDIVDANDATDDSIELHYEGFFSTCRLRKCFITLCKKILESGVFNNRCASANIDKDLVYQRDLVWSVYNTIQYLIDFGQYMEAQRLIERVNACPGICHGVDEKNGGGCGCHHVD